MAKARMAPLDHRAKWLLGEMAGILRPDTEWSLDGLNRAGLRFGMECLRVLGQLPPHVGELPDVDDGSGRGNLEKDDQVRLGNAEQELLGSLRPCWVDGEGLSLGNVNIRTLRLGEDFLRYLGLIGDYPGESIFARLVPRMGPAEGRTEPVHLSKTDDTKTEQASNSESDQTVKGSQNGDSETGKKPDTETENSTEMAVPEFVWDPEVDGQPSVQEMQFKGTCTACGKVHPEGAPEAIRFPISKRWLILKCCDAAERFLAEQAKVDR